MFWSMTEGWGSSAQMEELALLGLEVYMSFIVIL